MSEEFDILSNAYDFSDSQEEPSEVFDSDRYQVLSTNQVEKLMENEISKVKNIVNLPENRIRVFLDKYNFDSSRFLEKFYEDGREITNELLTISKSKKENIEPIESKPRRSNRKRANTSHLLNCNLPEKAKRKSKNDENVKFECDVCFDELKNDDFFQWECKHKACKECYASYIKTEISNNSTIVSLKCPGYKCDQLLDDSEIKSVLNKAWISKYNKLILNKYVQSNRMLCWCPGKNCSNAIEVKDVVKQPAVKCSCGNYFCFACSHYVHDFLKCEVVRAFEKEKKEHLESSSWLAKNCKKCPNCQIEIQKDGGCNHMTCSSCNYEFCWLCAGNWSKHLHCGNIKSAFFKNDLRRLNQIAFQHSTMLQSVDLDEERFKKYLKPQEDSERNKYFKIDFIIDAVNVLLRSRRSLADSFIFAYFMEDQENNNWLRFEINRMSFLQATENLSNILQNEVTESNLLTMKPQIEYAAKYCKSLHKALSEHVQEGYDNNWWIKV